MSALPRVHQRSGVTFVFRLPRTDPPMASSPGAAERGAGRDEVS